MKTPKEIVLEYYPEAKAMNVGTNKGLKYYVITYNGPYACLGKGKSSKAAWKAAYRNL